LQWKLNGGLLSIREGARDIVVEGSNGKDVFRSVVYEGIQRDVMDTSVGVKGLSYVTPALRKEKRLELIEYLFEVVLELMMNPDDNVSTSPGFERYLLEKKKKNTNK
jgi:hypothetical protein